jgi:hypothetical protein
MVPFRRTDPLQVTPGLLNLDPGTVMTKVFPLNVPVPMGVGSLSTQETVLSAATTILSEPLAGTEPPGPVTVELAVPW